MRYQRSNERPTYIFVKGKVGLGTLRNLEHAVRAGVGVDVKVRHGL